MLSHTHLAQSTLSLWFQNKIYVSLKSFGVLLFMFRKPFRYLFWNQIPPPPPSPLECFYACLGSLLDTYVLSHTHVAHSKLLLCVQNQNFAPLKSSRALLRIFRKSFLGNYYLSHTHLAHSIHLKLFGVFLSNLHGLYL